MTLEDFDDVFEPTLTQEDDGHGFGEPYYPPSLPFAAFFAGPIGAGVLVARNFRHLGMQARVGQTVFWFAGLTLLCLTFAVVSSTMEWPSRVSRWATQVLTLIWTYRAAGIQTPRFRIFQGAGGDAKSLFWPGVLAVVGGLAAYLAILAVTLYLVGIFQ